MARSGVRATSSATTGWRSSATTWSRTPHSAGTLPSRTRGGPYGLDEWMQRVSRMLVAAPGGHRHGVGGGACRPPVEDRASSSTSLPPSSRRTWAPRRTWARLCESKVGRWPGRRRRPHHRQRGAAPRLEASRHPRLSQPSPPRPPGGPRRLSASPAWAASAPAGDDWALPSTTGDERRSLPPRSGAAE